MPLVEPRFYMNFAGRNGLVIESNHVLLQVEYLSQILQEKGTRDVVEPCRFDASKLLSFSQQKFHHHHGSPRLERPDKLRM